MKCFQCPFNRFMEIQTKYSIGDEVWYVQAVGKRRLVEIVTGGGKPCLFEVRHGAVDAVLVTERLLGEGLCIEYGVCGSHGYFVERELFASAEEAQKGLKKLTK